MNRKVVSFHLPPAGQLSIAVDTWRVTVEAEHPGDLVAPAAPRRPYWALPVRRW
jgi:hypothetical protein